ncbi:MAG: SDR family NAD(P)-dependent oxidoreductase [Acidimicrobiales bacterium]|nr:SDR family NAD(P)-dependent oxidoreductase [Acidimicrobiales bacterium]
MGRLDGRVAVITGAGQGIGAATARRLAAEGAHVVVADLGVGLDGSGGDPELAIGVVDDIVAAGGNAVARAVDVTDHQACADLVDFTVDAFGTLDVLVNAAGILRDRMVFNMAEEEWDAVIDVHLKGCFNTTKFAAAHWRSRGAGDHRLINFTSIAGLHGAPSQPNYAAAKMGIVGFTFSCANALAKYGVTANCISPGAATRMTATLPADAVAELKATGGRLDDDDPRRSPDAIVPAIVYLASEESGWLTGRILGVQEYRISLWSNPEIQRQLVSAGPWELDDVFAEIPRAFRPTVEGRRRLDEAG